ncbi:1,4-beta-xylanase [Nissabacter sp. SGAir0207]|uniref:1,4-beta-xylanase n=1 Tax=Nissabacter sp. SGAir0207 TaxID=2126321 RepID=UPI0010CD028D|nr:1,4-beta-xylanase [Nissabacter sp. SGAir0207]QCR37396.1 1,4-beta-xylanase [Nissabacter sp. SGAir0207]
MYRQWSAEQAQEWHRRQGWGCGFNYLPRTAVNWLEMWQADTFDEVTIEQELGWAARYGYNQLRTNLPFTVWQHDRDGLLARIDRFLQLADSHGIRVMLTLLDDCAFSGDEPFVGPQKPPRPGVHNSQAAGSPGRAKVLDPDSWLDIEAYVRDVVRHFRDDARVQAWDLYNEPGNGGIFSDAHHCALYDTRLEIYALSLMVQIFGWARHELPSQPLTVAAWHVDRDACHRAFNHPIDVAALHLSDIISYHAYVDTPGQLAVMTKLMAFGRPVLCTEWLARHVGGVMEEQLPLFKAQQVGCYHWGLVQGKTQTWLPWPDVTPDPALWFHDVLTPEGAPFNEREMALVRQLRETA